MVRCDRTTHNRFIIYSPATGGFAGRESNSIAVWWSSRLRLLTGRETDSVIDFKNRPKTVKNRNHK